MPRFRLLRRFRQRFPRFTRTAALLCCFMGAFIVGFAYASWAMVCRAGRCPPADALDGYEPRQTSKIFAANGSFVAELGLERRTLVRYDSIPPLVRNAFVVTEDKRFYTHAGIDWPRVPGAMLVNVKNRNFKEGFSTITMQLARNIFPERISRDKSLIRKLKEAKVARAIEDRYTKDQILELYLNQIYLGNGAYGIGTAAQRYFGKSLSQLNLSEAALLAALPKGPERYNPRAFPERAKHRRNVVLALMRDEHIIDSAAASKAQANPLELAKHVDTRMPAPYFVEWVRQQLDDKFGRKLYEQGLKVYTTLDLQMQAAAERSLEKQIRAIETGRYGAFPHTSYARYMARNGDDDESAKPNSPYLQGAFIAMDPTTGAVRALVGGRDFDDNKFNRAVQAVRQPGSTFKPIVYAAAVRQGRPLSYLLDDSPLTLALAGSSVWTPQNFDGAFEGPIPLRQALYQSRNVPAIRLGLELGTQNVIDEARKFGITTPIPGYPSIFIGAADVYPIEIVAAYTTFATLGTRAEPMAITRVEDQQGNVIWSPEPTRVPVLQPDEAWLLVSAMKDVVQKGSAASTVGASFRYPAAGKTGTTNDGTDVWFIGFTSDLVAGVWMGFDRPQRIKANAQGGILAAPAWTTFMADVYRHRPPPPDWQMPSDILTEEIDVTTNMLPTPWCPRNAVSNERFIPGTDPVARCDVHTAAMYPDSNGVMQPYPPGIMPPSSYPGVPTMPYPIPPTTTKPGTPDTGRAIIVTPGSPGGLRPVEPHDTSRRPRPRAIFGVPPRDSLPVKITPPRDSLRRRSDTLPRRTPPAD